MNSAKHLKELQLRPDTPAPSGGAAEDSCGEIVPLQSNP